MEYLNYRPLLCLFLFNNFKESILPLFTPQPARPGSGEMTNLPTPGRAPECHQ